MSQSTPSQSRPRVNNSFRSAGKESGTRSTPSPPVAGRAKSVPPDVKKVRRSLALTKPKPDEAVGYHENNAKPAARFLNRQPVVEQPARPRRAAAARPVDKRSDELKELQAQVKSLKLELDKARCLNEELESRNTKLLEDLAASQAELASLLSNRDQESNGDHQNTNFKDIQKLIANKLEHSVARKDSINVASGGSKALHSLRPPLAARSPPKSTGKGEADSSSCPALAPTPAPPPPPPPLRPAVRFSAAPRTPAIVEFYHSLRKHEESRDSPGPGSQRKPAARSAHSSIVGEIQNRSAHLLAIKADVETKGHFINDLIQKVQTAAYTDIEEVLNFVDWLDGELASLADERAVLKHFNWPERKADAIREAAVEYRGLKLLESEISTYEDDQNVPCGTALKKMAALLDKSERSIQTLIKLRSSSMRTYQDWKIPVNWMLDTGIVRMIKHASMNLARMYMKRVVREIDLARKSDREYNQEALLRQGVQFAYKAHQFAGGLDSETMCAFEEIRRRVPGYLGGSQEVLAANIPLSS